jgi:hypothetical protein
MERSNLNTMAKKVYIYETSNIYRGYQTWVKTCATSYAEAARKLDVTPSYLKNYGLKYWRDEDVEFEGNQGYIDSGWIIFDLGRKELNRKNMPYEELTKIIDECIKEKNKNSPFGL